MKLSPIAVALVLACLGTSYALAQRPHAPRTGDASAVQRGPRGLKLRHAGKWKRALRRELGAWARARFDSDADGRLSKAERSAARAQLRAKLEQFRARFDTDGDGHLAKPERAAARQSVRTRLEELRTRFDADGDGRLSGAEREQRRAEVRAHGLGLLER